MASSKSISADMNAIATKKENLKKAFHDLQSYSSSLASFTLQWKDIEEHFNGIEQSIQKQLDELQAKEKLAGVSDQTPSNEEKTPAKGEQTPSNKPAEMEAKPRPELKSLCSKMDALGLRSYIIDHRNEAAVIRSELPGALRAASDPAKFVLDCVDGFYAPRKPKERSGDVNAIRRTCIVLLERLSAISPEITNPVRERAKKLAAEWNEKVSMDGETPTEAQAFLQLLVTYGIADSFKTGELCDILLSIGRRKQTPDLCKDLGLTEKMPDFVQKLISKGKQIDAINFIYAFELTDKFPPVPLLKAHLKEAKKASQEILKKGKNSASSQNEATNKELAALRAIIKVIEEHMLDSQYPRANLEKRIEQLEKARADRKRTAVAANANSQQQSNKKPRPVTTSDTNTVHSAAKVQPAAGSFGRFGGSGGLMGGERAPTPYLGSSGPYGVGGPGMMFDTPVSSFGASGGFMGFAGNQTPQSLSHSRLYSSESLGSGGGGLFDKPLGYDGYPLQGSMPPPAYRPSFYP